MKKVIACLVLACLFIAGCGGSTEPTGSAKPAPVGSGSGSK